MIRVVLLRRRLAPHHLCIVEVILPMELILVLSASNIFKRGFHRSLQISLISPVNVGRFNRILLMILLNLQLRYVELVRPLRRIKLRVWIFELLSSHHKDRVALFLHRSNKSVHVEGRNDFWSDALICRVQIVPHPVHLPYNEPVSH